MFQLVLLTSIFSLFLVPMAMAEDEPMDQVTIVKLDSAKGRHVTTRTSIHHVWRHEGIWFVSYGTGGPESKNVYRASRDGVTWSERKERPDGAWGYFDGGAGYAYLSKGGPVGGNNKIWAFKHWISTAKLQDESIQWGARVEFFKEPSKHMYFYYNTAFWRHGYHVPFVQTASPLGNPTMFSSRAPVLARTHRR